MSGRRIRLCLSLALCASLLLCAASVSARAAPTIEMYAVKHTALTRSHLPGGDPTPRWAVAVGMCMKDSAGAENISGVTVWDPAGEPLPNENVRWPWFGGGECSACVCLLWEFPSEPPLGSYTLQAHGEDGSESAVVVTPPFDHFPEPVPEISYPIPGSVITETAPEFIWPAYPGFACEGGAPAASQSMSVSTADEAAWLWWQEVPVEATSVLYGGPPLESGNDYTAHLWESQPWVLVNADPSGWYAEETRGDSTFTVYSPDPVIEQALICRGRFLWEPGATEETHHESAQITVRDSQGPQGLSVTTLAPDGASHPTPEDGGATWDDGEYRLYQNWCHNPPAPLPAGAYATTAEDAEGHTGSLLTSEASELPPMFAMAYPLDGEVIPEWDTRPVFSWEPALGADQVCVCAQTPGGEILWLKQGLPDTSTSVQYNDDGSAIPWELSPGSTYRVHVRAVYEEDQPSPNVTVRGYVGRTTEFTLYSPVPVIESLWVGRGRDTSPEGTVSYHERMVARVSDMDDDVTAVVITDSLGSPHDAYFHTDLGDWRWEVYGEESPAPAGTYTLAVTDAQGYSATLSAETSDIPETTAVIATPPANYSVASSIPTFSWFGPADVCYCLGVYEVDGPCAIWCGGRYVPGPEGSALYNDNGGAAQPELSPGHLYGWYATAMVPDPVEQPDPCCVSEFNPIASGRFWVEPEFVGPLQPINSDGSSIFKLGSTVPVKFQLLNADGSYVSDATATLSVAKIEDQVVGTYEEAASTAAAHSGNAFRYDPDANQYIFNLGTKNLSLGTWNLQVIVSGEAMKEVSISLR